MSNGCDTIKELWKIADSKCKITKPGISGSIDRTTNFIECENLRDFMVVSSLKCWEERGSNDYPPVVVVQDKLYNTSSSTNTTKK